MHTYASLRLEMDGHVAGLTLNRPEVLNAIDEEMHADLLDALLHIRGQDEIRVVPFAGEGRAFSAGGDLNEVVSLQADVAKRTRFCETGQRIIHALLDLPVPVVVALQGDAMGLGASIALSGDIIAASRTARIADPHVKVGLVAGDGGVLFWPASIGMHRARRYLLTRRSALGGGCLDIRTRDWIWWTRPRRPCPRPARSPTRSRPSPPIAVRGTKRSLNALMKARANEAFDLSMAHEFRSGGSEDILEAVKAFKEKREARLPQSLTPDRAGSLLFPGNGLRRIPDSESSRRLSTCPRTRTFRQTAETLRENSASGGKPRRAWPFAPGSTLRRALRRLSSS